MPSRFYSALLLVGMWPVFASAQSLTLHLRPVFDGAPLRLDSLRMQNASAETFSVTRFSLLLSAFALEREDGTWVSVGERDAWLDAASQRLKVDLGKMPEGTFRALRFAVGPDSKTNATKPDGLPADHPLNPNLNRMHWDWQGGYIFLAFEGRYRKANQELGGYVYHFANDRNRTWVQLPMPLEGGAEVAIDFDLQALLNTPQPISFARDGDATHSRKADAIAGMLKGNLQAAFRLHQVVALTSVAPDAVKPKPLYLPEAFQPFPFRMSRTFPMPNLPVDNPLTRARVTLGEQLFRETRLSRDGTVSCSSCHRSNLGFSDPKKVSAGIGGAETDRHAMPLFNLAWKSAFFWDGRASSLREQALMPIESPKEMGAELTEVVTWLNDQPLYRGLFAKAFDPPEPTAEKVGLAIEAFLFTLTSYNTRFDQAMKGKASLTEQEKRGFELFFSEYDPRTRQYGADCFHCHGGALFSDHQFHNNGLAPNQDFGREKATGKESDRFKFSTPSLRNVAVTAPYMHDGRFATLEQVVAHYTGPMHRSETLDPNLAKHPKKGLQLPKADQEALVAFMKTLTDERFSDAGSR